MNNPIKCDFCNSKADAREGEKPVYFCASCWLKKFPKKPVHGEYKEKKK